MARSKFEKQKAREKRKNDARRRDDLRRASSRTIQNAIQSLYDGNVSAADLARVLNAEFRPPPPHPFDEELAAQVNELRKEVDRYLSAFTGAMESSCREWTMIPGILVGGLCDNKSNTPAEIQLFDSEPYPLALGYTGSLNFGPVETYLKGHPEALAAAWCVTTKFDDVIDGLMCVALSSNRNGARSVHLIRGGHWIRLHGVNTVERFFVRSLAAVLEQGHPDGVLLAAAARIDALLRGNTTMASALGDIEGASDVDLQERMKPHLEQLRRALFGYHNDLMSLVDHIESSHQASDTSLQFLHRLLESTRTSAEKQARRAEAAESEIARLKARIARLSLVGHDAPSQAGTRPTLEASTPPLRERLFEIFK